MCTICGDHEIMGMTPETGVRRWGEHTHGKSCRLPKTVPKSFRRWREKRMDRWGPKDRA